jgi:hypothetical protein
MRQMFAASVFLVLFAGCSKNKMFKDTYVGTWELRSSNGGSMGLVNYNPGNGFILKFTGDSLYQYAYGLVMAHTYKLVKDSLKDMDQPV